MHVIATGQRKSQKRFGARTHAAADVERLRGAAFELHCSLRVSVDILDHDLQFGWATYLLENIKEPSLLTRSNDLVTSMKAMYNGWHMLFSTLLL